MVFPVVKIKHGYVEGRMDITQSGFNYFSFQGMRYARPPLFDRRFKNPEEVDDWNGYYNATYERDNCLQLNSLHEVIGNEDCLFVNVYTPKLSSYLAMIQLLLPVMVWIHGGGYISGSGDSNFFGPDYIVEQNVILVTMNYRLGVMGFMNLKLEDVSGNTGLKDQVMALKWIQENIMNFSGDPNNITIFGESTGGASVQYLMLSPMARGLFHKAISHSGSCLSSWSYIPESVNIFQRAVHLAKMSGRTSTNATQLLEILRNIPAKDLVRNANKLRTFDDKMRDAAFVFAPTVEIRYQNSENFLTQSPIKVLQSGNFIKIPYISGFNSEEGIYYVNYARFNKGHIDTLNKNFQYVVPADMNLEMDSEDSKEVAKLIKKFYFHGQDIENSTMTDYIDLYTDYAFLYKIIESSKLIVNSSSHPVYFYKFSFDGDFNYFKKRNHLNYSGSCHLDDLGYIFREKEFDYDQYKSLSVSEIVRNRMVKLWTNFAKFGNPTPNMDDLLPILWEPVRGEILKYMEISYELKMSENPEMKRMLFWNKLYKSFSNKTIFSL